MNVKSNFLVTKSLLPFLIKSEGSVINIASVVSSIKGLPNRYIYAGSKAAIIGFTKSLACDYVKNNVRFNCICPGTVETLVFMIELEHLVISKYILIILFQGNQWED